ncbi:hypothetical protein VFPBJ_08962 [Purpureocillium lilacinum]|uniref:Uncharacterized protein n=1 Tax=Purpureocillium lilacinum TaxID=33203 RepID=A0A179GFJ3_PURLI|nr:hypothetical protein Purlil1_1356 [Purpureocillium lilacinum]OAQ76602.1 hypothetical protein VFPBJ_08962 [Purpureocillium lilacinum]
MPHQSQSSGSAKSPLLLLRPQELHFVDGKSPPSPPEGCPLLPSQPDLTSSPCLSPLQGWLVNKSDREQRMLGLPDSPGTDGKPSISESQPVSTMPDKDDTSSGNSSWDLVEYDSDAARRCASPKRNEEPGTASQELARGREDRSKAPSPEQQTVEAEPPSPASSIMLGDAPIPEHATTRFAHLNEQLQPIGGLGDNTRSLIRYHRHVPPLCLGWRELMSVAGPMTAGAKVVLRSKLSSVSATRVDGSSGLV